MKNNQQWSKHWKSSTKPEKQRKYRRNAPQHVKEKFISANVSPELREELDTRSLKLRTGDQIKVMRGDQSGETGIVNRIDYDNERVYVNGITVERQNGSESQIPLRPSNLQVVAMNVDDERRMAKYDVDDLMSIEGDEEEMEEALEEDEGSEMMKQMQGGESSMDVSTEEDEDEVEDTEEETEDIEDEETEEASADYDELSSENIGDFKDALGDIDNVDYEAALEAEKANKNRKTMIDWLESKLE